MYKEVLRYFTYLSIPISKYYLRLQLESHPYFPSLVALKDTLDNLGIENKVCSGTLEELRKMSQPFLAHYYENGGQLVFYKNTDEAEKDRKNFREEWSGHVMFISKTDGWNNEDNKRYYLHERSTVFFTTIFTIISVAVLLGLPVITSSLPILLLTIFSIAGLYFSWLSSQKEMGIYDTIGDKICGMIKHTRCETVIQSNGARLFRFLSWGDVGIIYFGASLLFFLITQLLNVTENSLSLYYLICLGAGFFPIYSLYYQWKVVKQWCILCIGVLGALFFNAIIAFIYHGGISDIPSSHIWKALLLFLLIGLFVYSLWQVGKIIYKKSIAILFAEIKERKFRRNPQLFSALLSQQVSDPIYLPEKDEYIRYGNTTAPYQLVVACQPYCLPCAKAHHALDKLYERYPGKISVSIRFVIDETDDSRKMIATREILKAAKTHPYESIKDWYTFIDIEKFRLKHNVTGERVEEIIEYYNKWKGKANIKSTPTFFINGRRLPESCLWADFLDILSIEIRD